MPEIGTAYDAVDLRQTLINELDPDFYAIWRRLIGVSLLSGEHSADEPRKQLLEVKTREFVAIAALAQRGAAPDRIARHMRRAVEHGATHRQILAVAETLVVPGGAPTFLRVIEALMLIIDEDRAKP